MTTLLWIFFLLCLAVACYWDKRTRQVYRFLWWVAGAAAWSLCLLRGTLIIGILPELMLFILLQHRWFGRYYGKADCRAFSCCAVALTSLGQGLKAYLIHMLLAFLLLFLVQAPRKNIRSDGNLLQPVAFLPYITLAFLGALWYYYT